MKREEQIIQEAKDRFSDDQIYPISKVYAFIEGAKWADENPQFSKEEFVDKACEWLVENFYDHPHEQYLICSEAFDCIEEMVEQFMKAMEE